MKKMKKMKKNMKTKNMQDEDEDVLKSHGEEEEEQDEEEQDEEEQDEEEQDEEEQDEAEEEVEEVEIGGVVYYTSDATNGAIYRADAHGEPAEYCGDFVDGKPRFCKT